MYRYETHLHTALTSACSRFMPDEIVEKYVRLGYAGVFVTDHFLNGNTTVPPDLPWDERVDRFCGGYCAVKACAEGTGLCVFFGFEYSYKGTDFLVYGLEEKWLLEHEEIMGMTTSDFCRFARKEGGLVIQAHPCREDFYIDHIRLFPSVVDGFETLNASRNERCNRLSEMFADEYAIVKTAGSDIHAPAQKALAGMEFSSPLQGGADFAHRVKAGAGRLFTLTDDAI